MLKSRKKGFTLLELIIVLSIGIFISGSLAAGIIALQNITKLDTTIRDIKLEIQSAQNQARNSFITYNRSTSNGSEADLYGNGEAYLNVGWLISFANEGTDIKVTRQAIYFKPSRTYDIGSLRADILKIRNDLRQAISQPFGCSNNVFFKSGPQYTFRSSNTNDNTDYALRCAEGPGYVNYDYFEKIYTNIQLTDSPPDLGTNALPSCWTSNGAKSIFFSAGYGEVVMKLNSGGSFVDCQIVTKIQNLSGNAKAIKIYKDTGTVEICGNYCPTNSEL
jgi:prepilin-type N-terminal cleavage/methylation domain-containing protein